jgi:hypothetical protein
MNMSRKPVKAPTYPSIIEDYRTECPALGDANFRPLHIMSDVDFSEDWLTEVDVVWTTTMQCRYCLGTHLAVRFKNFGLLDAVTEAGVEVGYIELPLEDEDQS